MYSNSKFDIFDESEFELGNKAKIVVQQKRINGEFKIDVRVWMQKGVSNDYYPLKSGVCVRNSVIRDKLLPILNDLISKYE